MDLEALLQAREGDEPSGEDLEYDPDFTEMELAALPGEEKQVGDEFLPAEDPDFKEVVVKATAVLERSHDLRAAVFLAHAELKLGGLERFAPVTSYIRGCLEQFWDTCHPQLDEDDDDDPTMRVNAVLALGDGATIINALRTAPLAESRMFGRVCLRDIAVAEGDMTAPPDMDNVMDAAAIGAAFQDSDPEILASRLEAARTIGDNLKAIDDVFTEKTPGQGPDLDAVIKMSKQVISRLADAIGGEEAEALEELDGEDAGVSGAQAGGGGGAPLGAINSQNDVHNAIDRIIAYYQRAEPSSPVPILLARAKRLVGADFLDIVKDMAPNGVDNVNLIGGIEEDGY